MTRNSGPHFVPLVARLRAERVRDLDRLAKALRTTRAKLLREAVDNLVAAHVERSSEVA